MEYIFGRKLILKDVRAVNIIIIRFCNQIFINLMSTLLDQNMGLSPLSLVHTSEI